MSEIGTLDKEEMEAFAAMAAHVVSLVGGMNPTDTAPITQRLDDIIQLLASGSGIGSLPGAPCQVATSSILSTLGGLAIASPSADTASTQELLSKWCEDSLNKGFPDAQLPALNPLLVKGDYGGDIEGELRDLAVQMFRIGMASSAFDANVIGATQLGSSDLVRFSLARDGLVLANSDISHQAMRYLYKAWMSRNEQGRGLHFLRTYLQLQFDWFDVNQLWHRKDSPYPTALTPQFLIKKGTESDYYLTSRLAIFFRYRKPDTDKAVGIIKEVTPSVVSARLIPDEVNIGLLIPSANDSVLGCSATVEIESAAGVSASVAEIGAANSSLTAGSCFSLETESDAAVDANPPQSGLIGSVIATGSSASIEIESSAELVCNPRSSSAITGLWSVFSGFSLETEMNWSFA